MRLDMVGLIVADMKKSLDFYRLLGFEIPESANNESYAEVGQGSVRLSFNTKEMVAPIFGEQPEAQGMKIELAFLCESIAEIDELHQKAAAAGYDIIKEPWDAFWGQRYCVIEDPDGNQISLFIGL